MMGLPFCSSGPTAQLGGILVPRNGILNPNHLSKQAFMMVLPFKSPSAAQLLPLAQLRCFVEFHFRMLEFFFRIAQKQALIDGPSFQELKCCSSASMIGPAAPFGGILALRIGILDSNFQSKQADMMVKVLLWCVLWPNGPSQWIFCKEDDIVKSQKNQLNKRLTRGTI